MTHDSKKLEEIELIFSGIQPSGKLHLGNYLGAVKNWVQLQERAKQTIYCLVDCHAITVEQKNLHENTIAMAAELLACGISSSKSILFVQSHNNHHTELGWILSCTALVGWLARMTQFKEKASKEREKASVGLYVYPTLMAADILLYRATHVPVGEDQKQHLELTRDIAQRFNNVYNDILTLPEPLILKTAARVMSLRDGSVKMSKSEKSEMSRINLTDSIDDISIKIKKSKTDADAIPSEEQGLNDRPEAKNLIAIYASLQGYSISKALTIVGGWNFAKFKAELTNSLEEKIIPIGREIKKLRNDEKYLKQTLANGAQQARKLSEKTIQEVKKAVGFYSQL